MNINDRYQYLSHTQLDWIVIGLLLAVIVFNKIVFIRLIYI